MAAASLEDGGADCPVPELPEPLADEKHCASDKPEDAQPLIDSIAAFLKRERPAAGTFAVSAKGSGELDRWRDWQTPELVPDEP